MKAVVSTLIAFVMFAALVSFYTVASGKSLEYGSVVGMDLVANKVGERYLAMESNLLDILNSIGLDLFGAKVEKAGNFNLVTINFTLPASDTVTSNLNTQMRRFEKFANTSANETNLVIQLNTTIKDCFPLTINPYKMTFGFVTKAGASCPGFGVGQRDFKIIPDPTTQQYINGYEMFFKADSTVDPASAKFQNSNDCNGGDLNWTVTVQGTDQTFGPESHMIKRGNTCNFQINQVGAGGGLIFKVQNKPDSQDPLSTLLIQVQPCCTVNSSIKINLTDIPGRVSVGLPDQSIRVRETLFQVERNYTITIK